MLHDGGCSALAYVPSKSYLITAGRKGDLSMRLQYAVRRRRSTDFSDDNATVVTCCDAVAL